jgi:hypothetical protein
MRKPALEKIETFELICIALFGNLGFNPTKWEPKRIN